MSQAALPAVLCDLPSTAPVAETWRGQAGPPEQVLAWDGFALVALLGDGHHTRCGTENLWSC